MRLLIATDAWHPQVNGVVTSLSHIGAELPRLGIDVDFVTPKQFRTLPLPFYPQIEVAIASRTRIAALIDRSRPNWIHVATEGPIGWATRRHCLQEGLAFTTSYHTKFPEYLAKFLGLPHRIGYALIRRFHASSVGTMVATSSLQQDLASRGFNNLMPWTRGVDLDLFRPRPDRLFGAGPVFLYVGRVSREKNIEAFLAAELPGRKVVVGDGPDLPRLRTRFSDVLFAGAKQGEDLARHYSSADVFVFPSRTDTFGLVLLEAMASGLPVAAYPVTGPIDVVENGVSGVLSDDLAAAALAALALDPAKARARATSFSWANSAAQFAVNIKSAKQVSCYRNRCDEDKASQVYPISHS